MAPFPVREHLDLVNHHAPVFAGGRPHLDRGRDMNRLLPMDPLLPGMKAGRDPVRLEAFMDLLGQKAERSQVAPSPFSQSPQGLVGLARIGRSQPGGPFFLNPAGAGPEVLGQKGKDLPDG